MIRSDVNEQRVAIVQTTENEGTHQLSKDRNGHKNRVKRSGQAQLVNVKHKL